MKRMGKFQAAERKILEDVNTLLSKVKSAISTVPTSAVEGVALVEELRNIGYEDLNQIQHEYLILKAAQWLIDQKIVPAKVEWYWNPRQTGGADEPDLRVKLNGVTLISAEITTSSRPIGTIIDRMKTTLGKLNRFPGRRFYFVRSESMRKKSDALIKAKHFDITVVSLT